jgi:organic hydroperoxide reductase OsmC/OhrA
MSETTESEGHIHRYHATCHWAGDTTMGYESFDRAHTSSAPPASTELMLSADPAFLGHPQKLNPEQLLLMSASSCQLLSFLAEAEMPEDAKPMRLTKLTLTPRIVVGPGVKEERILKLTEMAHKQCYISNSLSTEITVEPAVEIREWETAD